MQEVSSMSNRLAKLRAKAGLVMRGGKLVDLTQQAINKFQEVAKEQGSTFMQTAALASIQSETKKMYKAKGNKTDQEFAEWYVGEIYKVQNFAKYLENMEITRDMMLTACYAGIEEAKLK